MGLLDRFTDTEKSEEKEFKKEIKKVHKSILDILPIEDICEDGFFQTSYGYMNIYQIGTKDVYSLNEDEIYKHISDFSNLLRQYKDDFKIVCMQFPVNTTDQQNNLFDKLDTTESDIYKGYLENKIRELQFLEEYRYDKEFYIFLYAKDNKSKYDKEQLLFRLSSDSIKINKIELDKKLKILFKLNNQNSKIKGLFSKLK